MRSYLNLTIIICFIAIHNELMAQANVPQFITRDEILISYTNTEGTLDTINIMDLVSGNDTTLAFTDQNQHIINSESLKNKVVLLDFWHLACPPCIVELPGLELLKKKVASNDFVLITFSIDPMEEIEEKLFKNRTLQLSIIPNIRLVSPNAYPLKALFGRDGELIDWVNSGSIAQNSIQKLINKYYSLVIGELR